MGAKLQRISPEMLIHPGETILEIIQDRNISQKELAIRTGFSEKHISTVISGQKKISADFAMKLQYALGIPASFWINLQANYDLEEVSLQEMHSITEEEIKIAKEIKTAVEQITGKKINSKNQTENVFQFRQILGVNNLKLISTLNQGFYRAQFEVNTSENIMYVWQYLCEKKVADQTTNILDIEKLKTKLPRIKSIMFEEAELHIELIQKELNDCGILFTVEKHVEKAPIKGLTVKTKSNQVMIALTLRVAYLDIFWFTLFHEIGHVINKDYLKTNVSIEVFEEMEKKADKFAEDILIDYNNYIKFLKRQQFNSIQVNKFAKENNVLPTIVYGRLMNDKVIPWADNKRDKYEWNSY